MLIYFSQLRTKHLGYLRFACFSVAAYAILSFASTPPSHGQHEFWDTIDAMIEEASQPEPEPLSEEENWDYIEKHLLEPNRAANKERAEKERAEKERANKRQVDDIKFDAVDAISGERQDAPAPQSNGQDFHPDDIKFDAVDAISGERQDAPAPQFEVRTNKDMAAPHHNRLEYYPHCSRSVRATDVLPANSPRRAYDGNLSQLHAYLSCVWWADGTDVGSKVENSDSNRHLFNYYNSKCADTYQCVAIASVDITKPNDSSLYFSEAERKAYNTHYYSDLLRGGFDNNDIPAIENYKNEDKEKACGLEITDLIIRRRQLGMANICSAKIKDPIAILCAGYRDWGEEDLRESRRRGRKTTYAPAPNPCLPASEKYYRNLVQGRLNAR